MNTLVKLPFYVKAALLLIGLYVFVNMLSIAQGIILPVIYATILAVLISPVVNILVKKKINRTISIAVVLITALLIVAALIALLSAQTSRFSEALPQLTDKFQGLLNRAITWTSSYFNISAGEINNWIANGKAELISNSRAALGSTLASVGAVLAGAVLTTVYVYMILIYQTHLTEFIHKLSGAGNDNNISEILSETKSIIQSYLLGLFSEFAIVAILNSIGLLVLGIEYAILLGIIGALLNIIPFIGGIIGIVLFMVIALVTKSPVYMLYVIILHTLIQFADNHYIVPKIVGAKVRLNALTCLIAVIAGDALWGIPGMFLAIPLTAIIKLILERIESLKPWGFLLGETIPASGKMKFSFIIKGFIQGFTSKKI